MATTKNTQLDVLDRAVELAKSDGLEMTRDRMDLIKKNIAQDTTDDEFLMFMAQVAKTKLDPFAKQIYCIKRSGKLQITASIDGLTLIAERTGKFAGFSKPIFKDDEKGNPLTCEMSIFKFSPTNERYEAATIICYYKEFKPGSGLDFMWNAKPHVMLGKVTRAQLLRMAFPQELSNTYEEDEVPQIQDYELPDEHPERRAVPTHEINRDTEPMMGVQKQAIREANNVLKWKPEQFNLMCQHKFSKDLRDLTINEADILIDLMKDNIQRLGKGDELEQEQTEVPSMEGESEKASRAQINKVFALFSAKGVDKTTFYKENDIVSLTKVSKDRAKQLIEILINMPDKVEEKKEEPLKGEIVGDKVVDTKTGEILQEKHISEMTDEEADEALDNEFIRSLDEDNAKEERKAKSQPEATPLFD